MARGLIALVVAVGLSAAGPAAADSAWAKARMPSDGTSRAIGGTSSGCLGGAVAMPRRGDGVRVMRPARRRHFGHAQLIAALRAIGTAVVRERLGYLALGDLSQPRGGPAPDGHASHQTGLDVDIWYAVGGTRKKPAPVAMVDHAAQATTEAWGERQRRVLELAAGDARVDRIFVNPVLKRALCQAEGDHAWLHKLRPWWGHDEHFHLRLACPADDADCVPQGAIADGDGCAELATWLSPEAAEERKTARKAYRKRIGTAPDMPAPCSELEP